MELNSWLTEIPFGYNDGAFGWVRRTLKLCIAGCICLPGGAKWGQGFSRMLHILGDGAWAPDSPPEPMIEGRRGP